MSATPAGVRRVCVLWVSFWRVGAVGAVDCAGAGVQLSGSGGARGSPDLRANNRRASSRLKLKHQVGGVGSVGSGEWRGREGRQARPESQSEMMARLCGPCSWFRSLCPSTTPAQVSPARRRAQPWAQRVLDRVSGQAKRAKLRHAGLNQWAPRG